MKKYLFIYINIRKNYIINGHFSMNNIYNFVNIY